MLWIWTSLKICRFVIKDSRGLFSELFVQKFFLLPKHALVFTCLQYMSFENMVVKGELAHYEQFLLFPQ